MKGMRVADANKFAQSRSISSLMARGVSSTWPGENPHNPLTVTGKKVMASMKKQHGKRGKEVFYRSINKKVPGSSKWHK